MMSSLIADPADTSSLSYRFRSKRDRLLRDFLLAARPRGREVCQIADLGGGAAYWERVGLDWLRDNGQMRYLFPDAEIQFERVAFLPKSVIATRLNKANGL